MPTNSTIAYLNRLFLGLLQVLRHLMSDLASSDNTKIEQVLVVIKGLLMGHGSLLQQNLVENMVHNVLACTKTSSGLVRLSIQKLAEASTLFFPVCLQTPSLAKLATPSISFDFIMCHPIIRPAYFLMKTFFENLNNKDSKLCLKAGIGVKF